MGIMEDIRARTVPVFALTLCWAVPAAQPLSPSAREGVPSGRAAFVTAEPAIVWRADGPEHAAEGFAHYLSSFSPDGRYVGIVHPSRAIRLLEAGDGALAERLEPESAERLSYSMAIASTGRVAVGRQGSMEVYEVGRGAPIAVFPCADGSCDPVSLAFSPDGSLLAFDEVDAFPERAGSLGSVRVVDLELQAPTRMQASAGLTRLSFSSEASEFAAAPTRGDEEAARSGFRIWHTSDWELPQTMLGRGWTVGSVPADSAEQPTRLVAVYATGTQVAMRDFSDDRLLWAAPLIRPEFADGSATRSDLDRIEVAPNGRFLVGYESPVSNDPFEDRAGAIVVRRAVDGAVVEVYDVPGVSDLAVAPDSASFVYTTGTGRTHTAMVRVPAL